MVQSESNSDHAVRFQLRGDLEHVDYALGHDQQLVVKDPLRLQYFLFRPFEKALLGLLSNPLSVFELKQAADRQLAPGRVEIDEIKKFLRRLLNDNLLVADRIGDAARLLQQNRREKKMESWQRLLGVLAIRFRGINPQGMLDLFCPAVSWLFHPLFIVLTVFGFFGALIAVGLNFTRIFETDFLAQNLANPRTALAIVLALGVVKVLHELGHAFACRSIGRDCHELGVMLLAFVPCLYCNVSDAWMEPSRWKRMLVSSAGIYVEMLIAILCVPLWLLSHDGPMQAFWFSMITICSVNTLLVNGNPLLRYDGYYVLSDLVQIPNLYSTSQRSLSKRLAGMFATSGAQRSGIVENGGVLLAAYALAAKIYRLFVVGVILLVIYSFFANAGLNNLGILFAGLLFAMTFGPIWWRTLRRWSSASFQFSLRFGRILFVSGLSCLLFALLLCFPITIRTFADGESELAGARIVYAPEQGKLSWLVKRDSEVHADQLLGRIENSDLELELLQQRQRVARLQLVLSNQELLLKQGADNSSAVELQKQSLASARKIEDQLKQRYDRLELRAKHDGRLVALSQKNRRDVATLDLSRTDSTVAAENKECSVQRSEPLAAIYDPAAIRIRLHMTETQIGRIAEGNTVQMIVGQASPDYISGVVASIDIENRSQQSSTFSAPELERDDSIGVVVDVDANDVGILINSPVKACVYGRKLPLYRYFWQEFMATLNL